MDVHDDRSTYEDAAAIADCPLTISEVGRERLDLIRDLNVEIFDDDHIINTFERDDLLMLVAWVEGAAVGFKIGYQFDVSGYYSAKGGVKADYRRQSIARALLYALMDAARSRGYERFIYDTFPNKHPGMTVMGLDEGFRVIKANYSPRYEDYRLRFERSLVDG
jgi:GNAT superfamily N-acetyltransferase